MQNLQDKKNVCFITRTNIKMQQNSLIMMIKNAIHCSIEVSFPLLLSIDIRDALELMKIQTMSGDRN